MAEAMEQAKRRGVRQVLSTKEEVRAAVAEVTSLADRTLAILTHDLEPEIYDHGKIRTEEEKLRMPDPHLTKEQVQALTTFLLGSQESSLPASYQYQPEDARRDIQEGWWIVRKYNCVGCHQFTPGQKTALEDMPRFRANPPTRGCRWPPPAAARRT